MTEQQPKTLTASLGMQPGTLETTVNVRHHTFGCDEAPPRYNSSDAFPDPYDYILAGLASCSAISIRLSAEAKGMQLERVEVLVGFERRKPEEPDGRADHITRTIALHGHLSDVDRLKLMRAADCAAYRSITSGIPVTTTTGSATP